MAAGGGNIRSTKSKNARQIPWSRSEYLSKAVYFKDEGEVSQIKSTDKLTILLKSKRVFVVFRQTDGAVAVLKDVRFRKECPSAMFDLCDHKGLEGAGMTLRYAVAKTDWSEPKEKVTLHKGDIILTLVNIHGHHVVGITQTNNVEVFPSNVVSYLTKPRLILRDGMVIKMKSVYNNHTCQLFKSTGELFGWKGMDGQPVLLDSYRETEGHTKNGNEEDLYLEVQPLEKKREEAYYASLNLTERTEDKDDHEWSEDDVYIAWERDDNQGNDDSGYDRPMGTVEGLSETPGTEVGYEEPVFIERTEQGENPNEKPLLPKRSTSYEPIHYTEDPYITLVEEVDNQPSGKAEDGEVESLNEKPLLPKRSTSYEPIHYTEDPYITLVEEVDNQPSGKAEDGEVESLNEKPLLPKRSTSYEPIHYTDDPYQEIVEEDDHQPSGNAEDGEVESLQSQVVLYEYCVTTPALHQCIAEHLVDEKRDEFGKLLKVPKNLRLQIETRDDNVIDKTAKLLDLWHERNGRNATVGVLVDALLKLHLEESTLLLTDMLEMLRIDDAQSEA
ncbi:uncharacterized protein [Apostichopus japonicus]|uniref:uncharacterized protein isoform X2 n=1 Tax=Stichopus japonicus TaxID=307972 RepID=UPI003AB22E14